MSTLEVNNIKDTGSNSLISSDGSGTFTINNTVLKNTPAFRAYNSTEQSIAHQTGTVISVDTENFDIGGCYNNTGSTVTLNGISTPAYSFAPNEAGKYFVNAVLRINDGADWDTNELGIFKNGSEYARCQWRNEASETGHISSIVDFNGTSDYVYMRFYHDRGSNIGIAGNTILTFFEAYKLIGA